MSANYNIYNNIDTNGCEITDMQSQLDMEQNKILDLVLL